MQPISLQPYQPENHQLVISTSSIFWLTQDAKWMKYALTLAKQGAACGEVPVGAVLVHNEAVIGSGFNEPIGRHDATAHAEVVALRDACQRLSNYRLPLNTTLYVTLEPCTMCVGALIHARVARIVYAAKEPRAGMVGSQMNLPTEPFYNHQIKAYQGLCAEHSSQILKAFFRQRRQAAKDDKVNTLKANVLNENTSINMAITK